MHVNTKTHVLPFVHLSWQSHNRAEQCAFSRYTDSFKHWFHAHHILQQEMRWTDPGAFHSFRPSGWISAALVNQIFPIDGDQKARINAEIYGASRPQDSGWLKKTMCSNILVETHLSLSPAFPSRAILTSRLNSPHPPSLPRSLPPSLARSLPPSGANQITLSTPRLKWADVHISCSAQTQTRVNLCLCPRRFAC